MDVLLMVDPTNESVVANAIQSLDQRLLEKPPELREHFDAQQLVAFALQTAHLAQHLDAVSVLVGVLVAKNIKVRIEVAGVPLTAQTLKEGLDVIRDLRELLSREKKTSKKRGKRE